MSVLAYPPSNDDEILKYCIKKCGYITSTEDQQFFALGCLFCPEKFLYFDVYIGHVQREHSVHSGNGGYNSMYDSNNQAMMPPFGGDNGNGQVMESNSCAANGYGSKVNDVADISDPDPSVLVPNMVMVKQEAPDEDTHTTTNTIYSSVESSMHTDNTNPNNQNNVYIKEENQQQQLSVNETAEKNFYSNDSYGKIEDYSGDGYYDDDEEREGSDDYDDDNYDDLVEESLLHESGGGGGGGGSGLAQHIKDRKMISFVIDSYRRNPYLWDHRSPHFRDRKRRQQFLDWMLAEFKRRFNVSLARDAITRKWDNLRTVYKRECNRMALERTNVSTLWYFKELSFLNRLYCGANKTSEPIVKDAIYRRRYSALWNDLSTSRLLQMMSNYPCFYDKNDVGYHSREKRGEALQLIATELQKIIDVSTIQISKRVSQLRFDYSKQKHERLQCELLNKEFVPNYSYYEQMFFMDADIAPFKCEFCGLIMQTSRDQETHIVVHQTPNLNGFICPECEAVFPDIEQYKRHKQSQHPPPPLQPSLPSLKDPKFFCDLCTASFREKVNYDEHMRRHNDELLLPGLANVKFDQTDMLNPNQNEPLVHTSSSSSILGPVATHIPPPSSISPPISNTERPFICDLCGKSFISAAYLAAHGKTHVETLVNGDRVFRCDFPNCGQSYALRQTYLDHMRLHYATEGATCDVCGKTFKSAKNLQNHKQIHDAIKRYVCKICGSAFAQAAGLYLHKRRHTRNSDGHVDRHRGRQSY